MVQLNSKIGFGVTYATGRYEELSEIRSVLYKKGSDDVSLLWADGEISVREVDAYVSFQSLDNGSIIEF